MGHKPYNVLQLTHSGRRSNNKNWEPTPLAVCENPYMDDHTSIDGSCGKIEIATDEKIEEIIEGFIHGAELAAEAGFDCVDVKVCHEYILRELLSAFTRPGKFGGSFENRTRALFDIIDGIRRRVGGGIEICVRLNAYDCVPYPYGWGMVKKERGHGAGSNRAGKALQHAGGKRREADKPFNNDALGTGLMERA